MFPALIMALANKAAQGQRDNQQQLSQAFNLNRQPQSARPGRGLSAPKLGSLTWQHL